MHKCKRKGPNSALGFSLVTRFIVRGWPWKHCLLLFSRSLRRSIDVTATNKQRSRSERGLKKKRNLDGVWIDRSLRSIVVETLVLFSMLPSWMRGDREELYYIGAWRKLRCPLIAQQRVWSTYENATLQSIRRTIYTRNFFKWPLTMSPISCEEPVWKFVKLRLFEFGQR